MRWARLSYALAGVLLLSAAHTAVAKGQKRETPPPRRAAGPRPGGQKAANGKNAPGIHAEMQVERLAHMPPEQRARILRNLPPERRQRLEEHLNEYNRLSPQEKQQFRQRLEMFRQLPPERQQAFRRLYNKFTTFPPERQQAVQREFRQLRGLSATERQARMNGDEFRNKYNKDERDFLENMVGSR